MRAMRPIRMKKPVRAKKAAHGKKSNPAAWWTGTPAIAGTLIGLMVVAIAGAMYESSDRPRVARVRSDPDDAVVQPAAARATPPSPAGTSGRVRAAAAMPVASEPALEPPAESTPSVTITGCLERADETFRLREADGAQVRKARNWKTGFLKKASATVAVVPAANRVNLSNHVGERVSLTGTLVDREMQVRSVQRIAASCERSTKIRT